MRIHTASQRHVSSSLPLNDPHDPAFMDTSVPAVFPPALRRYPLNGLTTPEEYEQDISSQCHQDPVTGVMFATRPIGTVSERLARRGNNYDENGIEVQLANGDLAMIGNRLCREDSAISINESHHKPGGVRDGRFERFKKICSLGTLSSPGSDKEQFTGISRSQHWMLMITPIVSSFSLALVIAAVVGPQWLLTEEKIPIGAYHNSSTHGSGTIGPTSTSNSNNFHNQQLNIQHPHLIPATKDDSSGSYLTKYTKSSLWMLCSGTAPGQPQHQIAGADFQCSSIDYFPSEGYSPDPNDSTNAIPYTVTHSSPFFLASNGVLIVSYGLFLVAMCSTKHKICYFVSGVLFIISGLLMLIGLIVYISILKAEIGSKLRPRSSLQAPQFTFRYGQSFLLYVFGFIITELSGILNVLIYTNVQQDEYHANQGGQSSYPTYQNLSGGIHYNLHYRREWPTDELNKPAQDGPPTVDYRYPYDVVDLETSPRYYFEQQEQPSDSEIDCRLHRRPPGRMTEGMTKSLSDLLYMEPGPASPESRFSTTCRTARTNGDGQRTQHGVDARSPNGISESSRWSSTGKLTRSVSTYTDLLPVTSTVMGNEGDRGTKKTGNICGLSRQYLSRELSKEKLFNEFCRKVGPRPKPKNIYYIESDNHNRDDSYRSVFVVDPSSPVGSMGRSRMTHRRRNSVSDTRRRFVTRDQIPNISAYRHRIRSDNSLDDLVDDDGRYVGQRRDPVGRARSMDYRQTLPRNFQQRHAAVNEPEDETGGFGERIAQDRKRVSASGLLLESERLITSKSDLTSEGAVYGGTKWAKHAQNRIQHHNQATSVKISNDSHCPKYLDPPTYTSSSAGNQQYHLPNVQQLQKDYHPAASHMYRSYGELATQHHHFRRPTILSPLVFSPSSQPDTSPTMRSILTVVQQSPQQQQHHSRHVHHQHHREQHEAQQHAEIVTNHNQSLSSPVFDLDRIEQERRKSHSQLFLNSPASSSTIGQYDFVNGTAV